jgi:hypothetical protein
VFERAYRVGAAMEFAERSIDDALYLKQRDGVEVEDVDLLTGY